MSVDENRDRFPVGMRILAVDDDPVCLKLLENLLLRCEYHVTTTNQAITALKMLRENKDKFDLVISDVHMPDMDGFKLLELVGLEMDLPVIMLSINGETQSVMKGITHGACDYLLKPVRIEELRNIWQHVVRRKKDGSKGPNNLASDSGQGSGSAERIGKFNKRRKDQTEEEEGTCEENETGNDDSTNQKKARVVWSVDLHRKFVAAVNYLGVDKAVPKKILDLMNVERLTRENVASHLQKYRLYLKRISSVANQANIFATFGGKDSYLPMMSSLDGFRDHHPLSRSGPLTNAALTSLQSGGALNSLNFPSSVGLHGLLPQENVQLGSSSVNSVSEMGGIQEVMFSENKPSNLLHGIPTSMEPNLDENKSLSCPAGLSNLGIDSPVFSNVQEQLIESGSFADNKMVTDFCMNSFSVSNPLVLQGQPQKIECKIMCNQSSLKVPFLNADSREPTEGVPSNISGHSNNSRSRQDDNMLTQLISNSLSFDTSCLSKSWPNADVSEAQFSLHDAMSRTLPGHLNSGSTISISHLPQNNVKSLSNSGRFGNNQMQNVNFSLKQKMGQYAQDASDDSNLPSIDTIVSNHLGQKFGRVNKMDATIIDHTGSRSLVFHNGEVQKSITNDSIQSNQFSLPQGPLRFNSYGTLGDLNNILKRERDDFTLLDGDIGCDIYPLGTCI